MIELSYGRGGWRGDLCLAVSPNARTRLNFTKIHENLTKIFKNIKNLEKKRK